MAGSLIITEKSQFQPLEVAFLANVPLCDRWSSLECVLDVKKIEELLYFANLSGASRKAVLHGADTWSLSVANRVLKLLEEPPAGFEILVLSETNALLPTISSRLIRKVDSNVLPHDNRMQGQSSRAILEGLFTLAARHSGHDTSKLLLATQSHI